MLRRLVRPTTDTSRRLLSAQASWSAQELRIPMPWGHIAGSSLANRDKMHFRSALLLSFAKLPRKATDLLTSYPK